MILADENIDHSLIAALRTAGYVVDSVYESHRSLSDEAIIELSRNPPRLILTEDKDFGEWVIRPRHPRHQRTISALPFPRYRRAARNAAGAVAHPAARFAGGFYDRWRA